MRIDWAVLCRYVEAPEGDTANILGAGIDTFLVADFPARMQVFIAVRMVGLSQDIENGPHAFRCRVLDPDLNEARAPIEHSFVATLAQDHSPGWEQGKINAVVVQFPAAQAGAYLIELTLDSTPPVTVPVLVKNASG